jgi:inner membrane protein
MDTITHAALGAAIGTALFQAKTGNKKGAIFGAIIANVPDFDAVLYMCYNSFDMLSIHRGMSHAIVFNLAIGVFIAYLLSRTQWAKAIRFSSLCLFTWLALLTHLLLDCFTTYGTQVLLPFSDARVSFANINIVDPIYTLPLLIGLLFSWFIVKDKRRKQRANYWGLILSSLYILLTLGVKQHVNRHFEQKLAAQNIAYQSLLTEPVSIGSLNWYGVAKNSDSLYIQKYALLKNDHLPFEVFPVNEHLLSEINPLIAQKMRWFANGFYTVEKENNKIRIYNLQVDMRGVVQYEGKKAPTVGYFEIGNDPANVQFSSGSIKQ